MQIKKAKVGVLTYDISSDESEFEQFEDAPDSLFYGQTQHFKQMIVLHPELKDELKREVLLHELLHCVVNQSGLTLDYDEEEQVVRSIAPLLTLVLQENKDIVDFISGR